MKVMRGHGSYACDANRRQIDADGLGRLICLFDGKSQSKGPDK